MAKNYWTGIFANNWIKLYFCRSSVRYELFPPPTSSKGCQPSAKSLQKNPLAVSKVGNLIEFEIVIGREELQIELKKEIPSEHGNLSLQK